MDLNRTFNPTAPEHTFFSSVHRKFSRIDHMLVHKKYLNKFRKIAKNFMYISQSQPNYKRKIEWNYKMELQKENS